MDWLRMGLCGATWLTAAWAAAGTLPDAQVDQVGNDVVARLGQVEEFLQGEQWSEAVDALLPIMQDSADQLIRVPTDPQWERLGFVRFVPVRQYVQMRFALWHERAPEALAIYRRRVDALAASWYRQAVKDRDESKLRRLVENYLLSASGDDALLFWGDLALERADHALARRCWRRISPQLRVTPAIAEILGSPIGVSWWWALRTLDLDTVWPQLADRWPQAPVTDGWLAYPDTDIPLAAVRARLALVSILAGSPDRARLEIELLRRLDPEATGRLGGRAGRYHERLTEIWQRSERWPTVESPDWTTLGGAPTRNRVAAESLDIALQPVWQAALPRLTAGNDVLATGRPRVGEQQDGLLSYHVAVSQGMVFVHQPGAIRALRLDTGEPVWPLPGAGPADATREGEIYAWTGEAVPDLPAQVAVAGVPRYCVTVAENRLFARMGTVGTASNDVPVLSDQQSFLVGIDLRTRKILFDRIVPDERGWQFEAAPLADTEHVFVSARRCDPVSSQVSVRAYRLATGQRAWRTDLARAAPITEARVEISHSPLTLDGDTLYYNSNLGVVAALSASDGRLLWVCRYPRRGLRDEDPDREDRHVFRDLTPCLVHQDLIFVAPADTDRILALDAATGHVVWTTAAGQAGDAVHLLGVGHGRLLAGGDSLYWIDVSTGAVVGRFPAAVSPGNEFARPSPRGHGRGVLAGSRVYWPTRERLFVFDQQQPRMVRQPIDLAALNQTGGHLVIAGETLLIASADRLTAWTETGRGEPSTTSAEQPAP